MFEDFQKTVLPPPILSEYNTKETNNEKLRGEEEGERREREIPKRFPHTREWEGGRGKGRGERLCDRRGMGKIRDSQVFPVSVSSIDGKSSGFS